MPSLLCLAFSDGGQRWDRIVGNVCVLTLRAPVDKLCAILKEFLGNILEVLKSFRHGGKMMKNGDVSMSKETGFEN